jgi:hypothetical protein
MTNCKESYYPYFPAIDIVTWPSYMNMAVIAHLCLSCVILTCLWLSLTLYQVQVDSFTASLKQNSACTEIYLAEMVFDREKCVFKTSSLIRVSTLCYNSYFVIYACFWQNLTIQGNKLIFGAQRNQYFAVTKLTSFSTNCVITSARYDTEVINFGSYFFSILCRAARVVEEPAEETTTSGK